MKFPAPVPVKWIAELVNAEVIGDGSAPANGINEIHKVETGDLCFVDHPKYYDACLNSAATHIIINTKEVAVPQGKTLLVTNEPFEAYLKIVQYFRPVNSASKAISDTAIIGENTVIMPNVFIGKDVRIGRNCMIHPNVSILDYTKIGNNVIIQSGSVIGSDAFYYNTKKNRDVWYKRMQSCGDVIIEDHVEIGAACTIDRGVTASTIIGRGTKMDNMVHIGHDTTVGKNCLFAAQVAVAGAVEVKDGVVLWGQVGVNKTITLAENTVVLAQSGIGFSTQSGKTYFGSPAVEAYERKRELVWTRRIPEMWEKLKHL